MKHFLLQSLHYTRAERAGTIALLLICGAVYLTPEILHRFRPERHTDFTDFQADVRTFRATMTADQSETSSGETLQPFDFDPNTVSSEELRRLGISEKVAGIICNYRNKGGRFREPDDLKKIYSLPAADFERLRPYIRIGGPQRPSPAREAPKIAEVFPFDPNLVSETDLQRLGLPERTVKGILNYRNKGGKFRTPEDFGKIYSLAEEDFDRLQPYIVIGALATMARPATVFPEKKPRIREPVDINRAALEDWLELPGIGEKRARQIVNFRESLGGFLAVEQVGEMYGLPDSVFQLIRPMLTLEFRDIHRINLNTASAEDLDRHPYISFKQATLIVNYRNQHGPFTSVNDLLQIVAFTDKKWLGKIIPYLTVQ